MTQQPPREARKRRRTVLVTAGLTASASVIAATIVGAQADSGDGAGESTSFAQYGDPLLEESP